jgi:gentisate 1,2-dioxygenase
MGTPPPLAASAEEPSAASPPTTGNPAEIYDYRQAANPVRAGLTEPIPLRQWGPEIHADGPTAVLPLNLQHELGTAVTATSPALAAHFLRILPGERLEARAEATSSLFYVLRGRGHLSSPVGTAGGGESLDFAWTTGDLFTLPWGQTPELEASEESVLYWVHDGPLLAYLGVTPSRARFRACHYPAARLEEELQRLLADPAACRGNRLSLLLASADCPASRTVTHTLWAMLGLVPPGAVQPPHRHQSVALDLILDCDPGCHTLVGTELAADGTIANPRRVDWQPGGVFVTPPGHWHSHVNPGNRLARLLPIQDAGLHTYLRSLDIRFAGGLTGGDD